MTISFSNRQRRMFYRNPQFHVGVGAVDFNEAKCIMFHPLWPGEILNKINFDVGLSFKQQEGDIHPSEYEIGFYLVKANDSGLRRTGNINTEYDYLNSGSTTFGSDSQASDTWNPLDKYVRELIVQRLYEHDETYADQTVDLRGSDAAENANYFDPNWNESTVKTVWKRSGWLYKDAGVTAHLGDTGSNYSGPVMFIDVNTSKPRKIYEPTFLIGGVFRPKPRIEENWNWRYIHNVMYWNESGSANSLGSLQLWNPDHVERILNDGMNVQISSNIDTDNEEHHAADRALRMSAILNGDNFLEDGAFSDASDTSSFDKGYAYLRGNLSIRTPIDSTLIRLGGGVY